MSDGRPLARGIRRANTRPMPEHEAFLAMIKGMIAEEMDTRTATMGTVVGAEGGGVRVHLDEEDEARELGVPRKLGQSYDPGDRVKVTPLRSGELVVDGTVSTASGKAAKRVRGDDIDDEAVGNAHVAKDSIDERTIKPGGVRASNVGGKQIRTEHLDSVSGGGIDLGVVAKEASIPRKTLDNTTQGLITNALQPGQVRNEALGSQPLALAKDIPKVPPPPDLSKYATTRQIQGLASQTDLAKLATKDDLDKLRKELETLKARADKRERA